MSASLAMHMSDGLISAPVSALFGAVAIAGVAIAAAGARRDLDDRMAPMAGLVAAFVFATQMLNFPVLPGVSGHLLGGALAAILVGPWAGALCITIVLVLQSLVFADGGLTALGANVFNMGVLGALVVGGLMYAARSLAPKAILAISAAGAWLAVMAGAAATALELAISGTVPLGTVLPAMLGVHALIGAGEAIITVAAISAVLSTRPDLVGRRAPAVAL
jgi:cobalt/nickel transport system permease protein